MKLRPFELALVIIFAVMAIAALILLATFSNDGKTNKNPAEVIGSVEIWGTLPSLGIDGLLKEISLNDQKYQSVTYRYIPNHDFDPVLTEALADGVGPDLIFTTHEKLVEQRRRIQPISYESFPLRDVQTQYIDGASIFALSDGLYGFPVMVDPLMLFWNTSIMSNSGFLAAPRTWEELINTQFPTLIERGFDRTIKQSVVAMGEYNNVRNSFGVISMLLIQSGTQGVTESAGKYSIELQSAVSDLTDPFRSTMDFFLRFSKPSNALYSWNRSYSEDRVQFISEELIFYFGFGSEGKEIERLNPNLRFDIAEVPQGATASARRTYGQFYGLSAMKSSDNLQGSLNIMSVLSAGNLAGTIASTYNMVPTLRSLAALGSNDTYGRFSYRSAPIAYGWLSPGTNVTDEILSTLTRDVNENRSNLTEAISDAKKRLESEYE